MGLITGGLNGCRFRVYSPLPSGFRDLFLDQVREHAFEEQPGRSDADPTVGWVDVFDAGNAAFELNTFVFDHFVALALRVDKKSVNGRYAQIVLARRIAEVCEERGVEKLSKPDREALTEAVQADLLGRALPSVATHDLCWDLNTGEVLVFSRSEGILELFRNLVGETFGVKLRPERPVDWLLDKLAFTEVVDRTQALTPGHRASDTQIDGWYENDPLEPCAMALASDFLLWLWQQSEASDGQFRVIDGKGPQQAALDKATDAGEDAWNDVTESLRRADLELWLESRLKMVDLDASDAPETTVLTGVAPSATDEARRTLLGGKRPVEAGLGLKLGDLECRLTLTATSGGPVVSGLKIPFEVKDGQEERIYERMFLMDLVHTTIKHLFQQFFLTRTSPEWTERVDGWLADAQAAK